ncbi:MAG: aldehyde dehydrogenase family protein [Micropepsaceae bacterium]
MVRDVDRLQRFFDIQKRALADTPAPDLAERLSRLSRLKNMLIENRERFRKALATDFGNHHRWMSDMMEAGSVIGRIRHFETELPQWLAPRPVVLEEAHGSSRAEILIVPKGVCGVIAPWNFPIECALVMVTDMFAAGNSVIIKPSELAPSCAQLLDEIVAENFAPEVLAVVQGGPELAYAFASLPWDHLTYTGSSRVGRLVAAAAAQNLTPLTLELGGKNPAVFAPDGVTDDAIACFLSFRVLKAGQVCTSPDYALVPQDRMEDWIAIATSAWRAAYPKHVGNPDATGIINVHHYGRILGYISEARAKGARVIVLNEDRPDATLRQIPMTLIVDPPAELACMSEEIFGPVVPVVPYRSIDDAMRRINAEPTPLAAYIATSDDALARRFVQTVRAGGAGVNTFGLQGSHPALPFGGFGASGYGCHSGQAGFLNYAHQKSVFHAGKDSIVHLALAAPLSPLCGAVVDAMFRPDAA